MKDAGLASAVSLAADETLTETFLRMGFDELSVSPSMILRIRDKIRNTDLSEK